MALKKEDELEFVGMLPPNGRNSISDFRIGDSVMAEWEDGKRYEAVVLNINGECKHHAHSLIGHVINVNFLHNTNFTSNKNIFTKMVEI